MAQLNREQLLDCALCPNMCRCECPVVQASGKEAAAPSGKARLAHLLLDGVIHWDEASLEALTSCVGCRGCRLLCPFPGLDLAEELLYVRREAVNRGIQLQRLIPYLNNLKRYGSPYGSGKRVPPVGEKDGEVLFFAGCTARANNPAAVESALGLFERAGVSYRLMGEEFCCGFPADLWGEVALARDLAAVNHERFMASGASRLVTGCPECRLTFDRRYPEWGFKMPFPVVDSTSYLLELVRAGRLQPRSVEGIDTVVYHDPCLRARVEEEWLQPRELLDLIPGLARVEADRTMQETRCCGGGQMAQLSQPSLSETMARLRLEELPQASAIVTGCPFCRESLQVGGGRVIDLVELLGKSCLEKEPSV